MNTLDEYKNSVLKMFFSSVEKDLNGWVKSCGDYYSPLYDHFKFKIVVDNKLLCLTDINNYESLTIIIRYKWFLFGGYFGNFNKYKTYCYVEKIKENFKKIEENQKNAKDINFLKDGLSSFQKNFIKDVRKEKLNQINDECR